MSCRICGAETAEGDPCGQCGCPRVPDATAKALAEARDLVAVGALDQSIRLIHAAIKAAPDDFLPHLRLAQAYERKIQGGEASFVVPAEREFREALRLAPADREVHVARLALGVRAGRLAALRAEYRRREDLPFSAECLKILDTLARTTAVAEAVDAATGAADLRGRFLLVFAAALAAVGLVELGVVVHRAMHSEAYVMMASMDFYISVACLTAAGVLALEAIRARNRGKGQ